MEKNIQAKLAKRGYTRNHLCLINPGDLAPAADIIVNAIHEHMASGMPATPENPQVVIMSESHDTPSHLLLQAAVLDKLAQWRDEAPADENRSFLFSIEQPYNRLAEWSAGVPELIDIAPSRYADHLEYDSHGRLSNRMAMYRLDHQMWQTPSKLARHFLFQTCWENNISTRFADAARQGHILDFNDPVLTRIADRIHYDRSAYENTLTAGENPLALRDAVMIERSLGAAKKLGMPLVIQQCGSAHLFGRESASQYKRSLTRSYKDALARSPLPVFLSGLRVGNITNLPLKALADNKNAVLIENLNPTQENDDDLQKIGQCTRYIFERCRDAFHGTPNPFQRRFVSTEIEDLRNEMYEAGLR